MFDRSPRDNCTVRHLSSLVPMLESTTNTIRLNSSHQFRVRSRAAACALKRFIDTLRVGPHSRIGTPTSVKSRTRTTFIRPVHKYASKFMCRNYCALLTFFTYHSCFRQHGINIHLLSLPRYSGKTGLSMSLEAVAGSASEYFLLSSSGTVSGECQPPSSSRAPRVTLPQPVVAVARISSTSHVVFDGPLQLPVSTHNPTSYDMMISLPSLLGLPATPTSSSSSSPFAINNSRTTSRVAATRRDDGDDSSGGTSSSFTATTSTTLTTSSPGGKGEETGTTQSHSNETPPSHGSSTAAPVPYAPTTIVTSYYTPSEQDATTLLTTVHATPTTAIVSGTPVSLGPHALISQSSTVMMTVISEWTSGGHTYPTIMTLGSISPGSVQPSPTGTVASDPFAFASESNRLSLILGLVFGVVFLIVLGVIIYKYRTRRRLGAELLPQPPLSDHENRDYQEWLPRDPVPLALVATPATLGGRIPTPPLVRRISHWRSRCRSQGDSSLPMSEVLSNPFADGSFAVSSQTSEPAPNNHFGIFDESLSMLHTTDNSELNFLAPIPSNNGTSIHSSYFSPTGHYHGRPSPT